MIRRFSSLLNISPLDGRYKSMLDCLPSIMSESGLIRNRIKVEVSWFIHLFASGVIKNTSNQPVSLSESQITSLESLYKNFEISAAEWVKSKEKETNHDLKAVEYYIKAHSELTSFSEYFHILCTSEDINNTAYSLMIKESLQLVIIPTLSKLIQTIQKMALENAHVPMLSKTHGQPASPTTVGKELANFVHRVKEVLKKIEKIELTAKCNGAVGNFNVHVVTFPEFDWTKVSKNFIEKLGLKYNPYTTQIEPHDTVAEVCGLLASVNTILLDFARDMWGYISLNYFKGTVRQGEVGSSTMPHKVNPIDFENAEGNLGISNSLLVHLQHKLPISRFQRDLSDSTALRNVGVAFGHALISYKSLIKGLSRLSVNSEVLAEDLNSHWEVLAEPVQMILRKFGYPQPYELLKEHTRGKGKFSEKDYKALVLEIQNELKVAPDIVDVLLKLKPDQYTGIAGKLAEEIINY